MSNDYLAFLPSALRPDPLPPSSSTWWRWRESDVHVLRVGAADARRRAVLLHGAGGHAGAMWPFAAALADRGFSVAVPDMPGYGWTRVPDRRGIRYSQWVELASDFVRAESDMASTPPLLIGASMGGMLAYEAATRTGAVHTVLVTSLLDPRSPAVRERIARTAALGRYAGPLLWFTRPFDRLVIPVRWFANMRQISNSAALVQVVIGDRLGGGNTMPLGFLRSFLDSAPAVEPEQVRWPRFVLAHPAADGWTPVEISRPFFDRLAAPKELVMLDGAGHFPIEPPGMHKLLETVLRY